MLQISPFKISDLDAVLALSMRSWEPVFPKLKEEIPQYIYEAFYPEGWRARQRADVEAICKDKKTTIWLAHVDQQLAGFAGLRVHTEDSMGEIYIIAVDPAYQRQNIGKALIEFSLEWMRDRGLSVAMVETGGDAGHAPSRAAYERAGFKRYPVARYFTEL